MTGLLGSRRTNHGSSAAESPPAAGRRRGLLDLGDARAPVLTIWVALMVVVAVVAALRPGLLAVTSLQTMVSLASVTAVVGLGQGLVIFVGGIDLSVPSTMAAAAIVFSTVTDGRNALLLPALAAALLTGALIGCLNGVAVTRLTIHPVVTTLAMGAVVAGILLGWTDGVVSGDPPPVLGTFMNGVGGSLPGVIVGLVALTAVVCFVYRQTRFGRELQAVGLNPLASRLAGLRAQGLTAGCYGLSGVFAALAGVMLAGVSGKAYLDMGAPYLLTSVAVVALGGASFTGGRGHFLGTLGGALLLSLLITLLVTFQLPEAVRTIVQGLVILGAVVATKAGRPRSLLPTSRPIRGDAPAPTVAGSAS